MTPQVIALDPGRIDTSTMTSMTPSTDANPTTAAPATPTTSGARWFYAIAAVAGTAIPWIFFGSFLAAEGVALVGFVEALFENGASGGFAADLLITAGVFWFWSFRDSRVGGVERWWLVVPATLFVGLSLAVPLYLYWRESRS